MQKYSKVSTHMAEQNICMKFCGGFPTSFQFCTMSIYWLVMSQIGHGSAGGYLSLRLRGKSDFRVKQVGAEPGQA